MLGNPNPHIPPICLYPLKKIIVLSNMGNLHLSKLNLSIHKICLVVKFIDCINKIISLSYEIVFC
jgi:hypothetical protein